MASKSQHSKRKSMDTTQIGVVALIGFAMLHIISSSMSICLQGFSHSQDYRAATGVTETDNRNETAKRLGDGCHHVFLDVGANLGVHTRFLFEPDKYPLAENAIGVFDQEFGTQRDNRDFCAFGFEPNPNHKQRHLDLEQAYKDVGWRYTYIGAGVSDETGNLTFWHQGDVRKEEWGFAAKKQNEDAIAVDVPVVHLGHWIETHIAGRLLPNTVYGNYSSPFGRVVMKMDIEGSEYNVLPSLLFTGVLCEHIDFFFGEPHPWSAKRFRREATDKITGKGAHDMRMKEAVIWWDYVMVRAFKTTRLEDCKTIISSIDDENYLHDGILLPNHGNSSE